MPVIDAPQHHVLGLPPTFTEKTAVPDKPGKAMAKFLNLADLDMTTSSRASKPRGGVELAGTDITFHLDVECDEAESAALDAAARRVPYFGTSKDPADLSVTGGDTSHATPPVPQGQERWFPYLDGAGKHHGWQANTIEWFDMNHRRTFSADPAVCVLPLVPPAGFVRPVTYSRRPERRPSGLEVVPLVHSVPHHRIPSLMRELSERLNTWDPLAGAGGQRRWRVFPITVSHVRADGVPFGDGRAVGIGVVPAPDPTGHVDTVAVEGAVAVTSAYVDSRSEVTGPRVGDAKALQRDGWLGPALRWRSTTPFRGHPDARVVRFGITAQLREQFDTEPDEIRLSRTPRLTANGRWSDADLADGLAQWWVEVTFPDPVRGPIVLGAATDSGFGVFGRDMHA